jgi:hypothetical protein
VRLFTDASLRDDGSKSTLQNFLAGLKNLKSEDLIEFFAQNAQFIDASGRRWDHEGISQNFETLFAIYSKKNTVHVVEAPFLDEGDLFAASVQWKNAILASEQRNWVHRMSIVLIRGNEGWLILLVHVTSVQLS